MDVRAAIESGNVAALRKLLAADPTLANQRVVWGSVKEIRTHPLHFVADKLFDGTLDRSSEVGIGIPLIDALIAAGADVNFFAGHTSGEPGSETPLNGAASLGCQDIGIRLIGAGARTDAINLQGETALHWAATLGLTRLVSHILLIEAANPVSIHIRDPNWDSSPLGWAMHGWSDSARGSAGSYREVVAALVRAGAEVKSEWLASSDADPEKLAALRGES